MGRYLGNLHGKNGFAARPSNLSSLPKTLLMITSSFDFLGHSCYSFQSLMTSI